MKRFTFRLERVLTYRKYREKKALGRLVRVRKAYKDIQNTLDRLSAERSAAARACAAEGKSGIDAFRLRMYAAFAQRLAREIENTAMELQNAEASVRRQEAAVKRATQKRKALEILKDHRMETYRKRVEQEDQKRLDELVVNRKWVQT